MIKSWMESLLIALSMYSALPVKCLNWTEKNLRNAMVFFPLVGLLCGVGLFVVWTVCELLHVGAVLFGVLAVLSGVLITGGIHLDGFCDTADALYSRRPQEEKLRILKDPNCGPFAVFSVVLALLVSFGAYVQIYQTQNRSFVWLLTGVFVLSRCLSGLSVTAAALRSPAHWRKPLAKAPENTCVLFLVIVYGVVGLLTVLFWDWLAVVLAWIGLFAFFGCSHMAKKQFGGITGDLAGFFLVLCETVCLLGAALLGGVLA